MTRWRLAAEVLVERAGAATVSAAALLLVVAVAGISHVAQLQGTLERTQAELAAARGLAAAPRAEAAPVRPTGNLERLALFERTLGKRGELDAHLRTVFAAA